MIDVGMAVLVHRMAVAFVMDIALVVALAVSFSDAWVDSNHALAVRKVVEIHRVDKNTAYAVVACNSALAVVPERK